MKKLKNLSTQFAVRCIWFACSRNLEGKSIIKMYGNLQKAYLKLAKYTLHNNVVLGGKNETKRDLMIVCQAGLNKLARFSTHNWLHVADFT